MDVKTLCLGLLSINEACGYDLKKEFESIFKHFYSAGYGSIYPALADLAENDLVSCREIPQDGKPDRKTYRITEAGRKAFGNALRNTNPQHKMRSEFLAMLYFADLMESDHLRTLMDDRVKQLRDAVLHIDRIEKEWGPDTSVGAKFVAGFGSAISRAAADYIESNREMLFDNEVGSSEHCNVTTDGDKKTVETRL
jgi:DNA-binding PadR family transcriptional regulator